MQEKKAVSLKPPSLSVSVGERIHKKISLTTNSLNVREIDNNQNNMTAIHTPIAKAASITVTVGIPPAIIIDLSLIPFLDW